METVNWEAFQLSCVLFLRELQGQGEKGRNNRGQFIEVTLGGAHYVNRRTGQGPAWCALLVGYAMRETARQWGIELPFDPWRYENVPEAGARTLWQRIRGAGRSHTDLSQALPGDAVLWRRKNAEGAVIGHHIAMVANVTDDLPDFTVIEGNVGRFPAVVRVDSKSPRDPNLVGFASLVKP